MMFGIYFWQGFIVFLLLNYFRVALTQKQVSESAFLSGSLQNPLQETTENREIQELGCLSVKYRDSKLATAVKKVGIKPSLVASTSFESIPLSKGSSDNAGAKTKNFKDLEDFWMKKSQNDVTEATVAEPGKSVIFKRAKLFEMPSPNPKFDDQSAALGRGARTSEKGSVQSGRTAKLNHLKSTQRIGKTSRSPNTASKKYKAGNSHRSEFNNNRNIGFAKGHRRNTNRRTFTKNGSEKVDDLTDIDVAANSILPSTTSGNTSPYYSSSSPNSARNSFTGGGSQINPDDYPGSYNIPQRNSQFNPNDFRPPPGLPPISVKHGGYKSDSGYSTPKSQEDSTSESHSSRYETIGGDDISKHRLEEKKTRYRNRYRNRIGRNAGYAGYGGNAYDNDMRAFDPYDELSMDRGDFDYDGYSPDGVYGHTVGGILTNSIVKMLPAITSVISGFTSYDHAGYSREDDMDSDIKYDDNVSNDHFIESTDYGNQGKNRAGSSRIVRGGEAKSKLREGIRNSETIAGVREPDGIKEEEESSEDVNHDDEKNIDSGNQANSNFQQNNDTHEKRSLSELTEKFESVDKKSNGIETPSSPESKVSYKKTEKSYTLFSRRGSSTGGGTFRVRSIIAGAKGKLA